MYPWITFDRIRVTLLTSYCLDQYFIVYNYVTLYCNMNFGNRRYVGAKLKNRGIFGYRMTLQVNNFRRKSATEKYDSAYWWHWSVHQIDIRCLHRFNTVREKRRAKGKGILWGGGVHFRLWGIGLTWKIQMFQMLVFGFDNLDLLFKMSYWLARNTQYSSRLQTLNFHILHIFYTQIPPYRYPIHPIWNAYSPSHSPNTRGDWMAVMSG